VISSAPGWQGLWVRALLRSGCVYLSAACHWPAMQRQQQRSGVETCLRKGSGRASVACDACYVPFPTRARIPPASGCTEAQGDGDSWPMSWGVESKSSSRPPTKVIVPPSHQERRAACADRGPDSEPWNVNCHPEIAWGLALFTRGTSIAAVCHDCLGDLVAPAVHGSRRRQPVRACLRYQPSDRCGMCSQDPRFITIHADSRFMHILIARERVMPSR
jgi:hypothetical protein